MIVKISGKIDSIENDFIIMEFGGLFYQIMTPPVIIPILEKYQDRGTVVNLHTIHYLEGGFGGMNQIPRLLGFLDKSDKVFFELYTKVKGLGEKKALKSLKITVGEIALAIEQGDIKRLSGLPGISARLAEKIVAELKGKVAAFALAGEKIPGMSSREEPLFQEDALEVLVSQLGYRRQVAEEKIRRVLDESPEISSAEDLIKAIFYQGRGEAESKTALPGQ